MTANVLIFTPTWETEVGKYAMHYKCPESIQAQRSGFDGKVDWCIGVENPYPVGDFRNVLMQYQKARELFLSDSYYDALLTVEHDNVMTTVDTLQVMYDTDIDVVYAPYMLRHNSWMLSTWSYVNDRNLGMSLTNYPDELAKFRQAGVGRICGTGFGCTLIRRHVMEALEFRPSNPGVNWCPDLAFSEDCLKSGFVALGRFDKPVDHYENGLLLEAFGVRNMEKYIALQTCNAVTCGEYVRLEAGEVYEFTKAMAFDLLRIGLISLVVEPEQIETAAIEPAETAMLKHGKKKRL